jgi:adenylate kinase
VIIFMGVAGSGKSVQGKMLADELGLPWLSTGEFLRMLITGNRRKEMLGGQLLEDEEVISLVQKTLTLVDTGSEFVLDGFPRTVGQADWLLNQVKHNQLDITAIVHIVISKEAVRERLLLRARPDDHHEAIEKRFKEYDETILAILNQFKNAGITVHDIDGEQNVEEVHASIMKVFS